jgi:putative oxidoreductase
MDGLSSTFNAWAPRILSVLRIIVGLLILQYGLMKLLSFPAPFSGGTPAFLSLIWFAGAIEIVGGILIVLGLLTRPAAFILAGEMAFAYFIGHAPRAFYPILNGGNLPILYCFVFFYLVFAGPGPWSVDAQRERA